MKLVIYSCSLRLESKSRELALSVKRALEEGGNDVRLMDFSDSKLPLCDAGGSYGDATVQEANASGEWADGIVIATPVYNYTVNSTVKSLVEHCGRGWTGKTVGFVASAGGFGSYMALMGTANSLMLDFRCIILPRFVYATEGQFEDGKLQDQAVVDRIATFSVEMTRLTEAVSQVR